jgi:hypothetical protein
MTNHNQKNTYDLFDVSQKITIIAFIILGIVDCQTTARADSLLVYIILLIAYPFAGAVIGWVVHAMLFIAVCWLRETIYPRRPL